MAARDASRPAPARHVLVCVNQRPPDHPLPSCGHERGMRVYAAFQRLVLRHGLERAILVTRTLCLSTCQHGPSVVVYPEGVWYGGVDERGAERIFREHLLDGRVVEELRMPGMRPDGEEGALHG